MLATRKENLPSEESEIVRKWLKEPGAKIFTKLVSSQLHENQIDATKEFCDERDSHEQEGRTLMKKSAQFRHTLEVVAKISDPKEQLYTVKIVES